MSTHGKTVYTLGTGRRSEEDFIEILTDYDIRVVADVRAFPRSKVPHFTRDSLKTLLQHEEIGYRFLGEDLGGFRKGGYERYTLEEGFSRGIAQLEEVAQRSVTVIICAEHFPWKCHRRWIARELQRRGWHVIHIIDKGKTWEPR